MKSWGKNHKSYYFRKILSGAMVFLLIIETGLYPLSVIADDTTETVVVSEIPTTPTDSIETITLYEEDPIPDPITTPTDNTETITLYEEDPIPDPITTPTDNITIQDDISTTSGENSSGDYIQDALLSGSDRTDANEIIQDELLSGSNTTGEEAELPTTPIFTEPEDILYQDSFHNLVPDSLSSYTASGTDMTYCSALSRMNLMKMTGLPSAANMSIDGSSIAQGDAITLIRYGLDNNLIHDITFEYDSEKFMEHLEQTRKESGNTIFDLYSYNNETTGTTGIEDILAGHRFIVFYGSDNLWYIVDTVKTTNSKAILLDEYYAAHVSDNKTLYMYNFGYKVSPLIPIKDAVIEVIDFLDFPLYAETGKVSIEINELLLPYSATVHNSFRITHTGAYSALISSGVEVKTANGDILHDIALHLSVADDATISERFSGGENGAEFGISGQHLTFSKPIQLTIPTDIEDGTNVNIQVQHAGETITNQGVTINPNAVCTNGISSDESNRTLVKDKKVVFYTCAASTFVVSASTGSVTITNIMSGSSFGTGVITIAGTGSNTGDTITLAYSGGSTIGTTTVDNDNMRWIQTVSNPLPVGNHTICVNGGGSCVDIIITDPNMSANVIDDSFTGTAANSIVSAIIQQPDGNYMVGGSFTTYNGVTKNRIARVTSTGAIDSTFTGTAANNSVSVVIQQPDGNYMIGGGFTTYNGVTKSRIARVTSTGVLDSTFTGVGPGVGTVTSIVQQPDGKYMVGGTFTTYNGTTGNRIVRVNSIGAIDPTFTGTAANSNVDEIIQQPDGKYIVWGSFTTYNGVTRNRIVRLTSTGAIDTTFTGTAANAAINKVIQQPDGKYMVAGTFSTYNGVTKNRVARLTSTGALDSTFTGAGPNNTVDTIVQQPDGKYLVGGTFTTYNGVTVNMVVRLTSTGAIDSTFTGGTGAANQVAVIIPQPDGKYILGGQFTSYNSVTKNRILRLWGYSLTYLASTGGSISGTTYQGVAEGVTGTTVTAVASGGYLFSGWSDGYTGDTRTDYVTGNSEYTAYFNIIQSSTITQPITASSFGTGVVTIAGTGNLDGIPVMLTYSGGALIGTATVVNSMRWIQTVNNPLPVGNHTVCVNSGASCIDIIITDPIMSESIIDDNFTGAGANDIINIIIQQPDGKYMVGGSFTTYNGVTRNRIVRVTSTGAIDTTFTGVGPIGPVNSIIQQSDGGYIIGGGFITYNGVTVNRIVRVTSTGAIDPTFTGTRANNVINTIVQQPDGKYIIGGTFTTYNGVTRNRIVRVTSTGAIDTTFTGTAANNVIYQIAQQPDGNYIIGGGFTTYNGVSANRIVRVTSTGAIDTTFAGTRANNIVWTVIQQPDGKYMVGGDFTSYNGVSTNYILRVTSTGVIDPTFTGTAANLGVGVIIQQADGNYMLAGGFSIYNGENVNRIVRVSSTGAIDPTFTGTKASNGTTTIFPQPDGRYMLGGLFTSYNGITKNYILRLGGYSLTYLASTGGTISGNANQTVPLEGGTGTSVTAVANGNYIFSGWSDGYTGATRTDYITGTTQYTAYFTFVESSAITQPMTVSSFGTGVVTIAGIGNLDGIPVTLAYSGGALIGTATVANGMRWVQTVDNPLPVGNHTICINSGGSCIDIIITDPNMSENIIDDSFTGAGADRNIKKIIQQPDGKYMVGGEFTSYNSVTANRIVRVTSTGEVDTTFTGTAANNAVNTVIQQPDGKYIIGGLFTSYNGVTANRIVRVTSTGEIDPTFTGDGAGASSVNAIVQQPDGKYIVGGDFTTYNGVTANRIVRVTSTGEIDPTFISDANNTVNTIIEQPDGNYMVGGSFTTYNGITANRIVRITSTGAIDPTFTGDADNVLTTIIQQSDGNYMVGGGFTSYNGVSSNYIVRVTSTGAIDTTFTGDANNVVNTIVQQGDGKYIIGGAFTTYNGVTVNHIIRVTSTGAIDPTFTGTRTNGGRVDTILPQSDGKYMVGGNFTTYNGITKNYIVRLGGYSLIYLASTGGTISGNANQTVPLEGGTGTSVTAVANRSYIFSGWSDGYTGDTRTDYITGTTQHTAYFTLQTGDLCLESPDTFALGSVTIDNTSQIIEVQSDYFKVIDQKGSNSGYYTTLSLSNLTGSLSGSISNSLIEIKADPIDTLLGDPNPAVVLDPGIISYTSITSPVTFIKRDAGTGGNIVGIYGSKVTLKATIPAYQTIDTYTGTLTHTLYEN